MCISVENFACRRRRDLPTAKKRRDFQLPSLKMTGFDMYPRHTQPMMNIELARIIQAEREQEIQAELRRRRLLGGNVDHGQARPTVVRRGPLQRPASGIASR